MTGRPGDTARGTAVPGEPCDADASQVGEPEILVVEDPAAAAIVAAERLVAAVCDAVESRGRADVSSTGGSTPVGVYAAFASPPLVVRIPWDHLHLWLGDDRFVPRTDPLSNMIPIDRGLLGGDGRRTPLPPGNVHPWPTDAALGIAGEPLDGPTACAASHAAEMRAALPTDAQRRPVFDAVLLGMGADGHVMSLFPGGPAIDAPGWTVGVAAPSHIEPHVRRVTCTPAILCATPRIVVVVTGPAKAAVVARVLTADRDVHVLPAQLARRAAATWILDREAAAALR